MVNKGEVVQAQPRGLSLLTWENLDKHKFKPNEIASTSAHPPQPLKQVEIC